MRLVRRVLELALLLLGICAGALIWGAPRVGIALLVATVLLLAATTLVLADHVERRP
jgi:hypothetical protein